MAERRTGAGHHLSGVLEQSMPPSPPDHVRTSPGPDAATEDTTEADVPVQGRGASQTNREPSRKASNPTRQAKKPKGRTVYLSDDLFERILVQAHRKDKTISEYVSLILERQVPDHRVPRDAAADSSG